MALRATSITMGKGDLRPELVHYIEQDKKGTALDITTADSVKFYMYPVNEDGSVGTVKVSAGAVTVVTAASGHVKDTWTGTDTDTVGLFRGHFVVYWGATQTIPQTVSYVEINIVEQWDKAPG